MASHDNPALGTPAMASADATIEQIMSAFGAESAENGADLVIQDLDQCSAGTPAWTYCG